MVAFPWLFVWLFINLMMREQVDANVHRAIACKYLSNNICTVVGEWHHGYFCLGYFFSSTHFDLVTRRAHKVWRHCGLVFGHDRCSHAGRTPASFLFTGNRYLFLLLTPLIPFLFLTTAPVSILLCLAPKFRHRSF